MRTAERARTEPAWPRSHAAAAAIVRAHLPEAAGATLERLGAGDFCLALRLGTRVVRVARHAEAAAALEREACVLAAIAGRLPLPVPRPAFARPADGRAFSVHARVDGVVLTRARWSRLSAARRERAAAELARFLGALHALPPDAGVACGVPVLDLADIAGRLRPAAAPLRAGLTAADARRLDALLARSTARREGDVPRALLHRDVAPGHVLHDPASGALTGVIDFGDVALGDPARDLVYVYEDFGPAMLAAVLRHYPGEAAATLRPRVHLWFLLEAVEWTLARLGDGARAEAAEGLAAIVRELDAIAAGGTGA